MQSKVPMQSLQDEAMGPEVSSIWTESQMVTDRKLAQVLRLLPYASILERATLVNDERGRVIQIREADFKHLLQSFLQMIPFDEQEYLRFSTDLALSMADGRFRDTGERHFILYGYFEGRRPFTAFLPRSFDDLLVEANAPSDYFEQLYAASISISDGCYRDAERILTNMKKDFSPYPRAMRLLSQCYNRRGKPRAAYEALVSLPIASLSPFDRLTLSMACRALHLYDDGLKFLQLAAEASGGGDESLTAQLANLQVQRGHLAAARHNFRKVRSSGLGGDGTASLLLLERLWNGARSRLPTLIRAQRTGQASLEEVIELIYHLARLGFLRAADRRINSTLKVMKSGIAISEGALHQLTEALRICRGANRALAALELIGSPNLTRSFVLRKAQLLYSMHMYKECLQVLDRLTDSDHSADTFLYSCNAALMSGNLLESLNICRKWRDHAPKDAGWAANAMTVLFELGTLSDSQVPNTLASPLNHDSNHLPSIPRHIIQYWNREEVPADVLDCMGSWKANHPEFQYTRFNDNTASEFLASQYGGDVATAFEQCPHPAMKADYFRLGFLYACGGYYIDADERSVQPLTQVAANLGEITLVLVRNKRMALFNSPIFCAARHRIIGVAFEEASQALQNLEGEGRRHNVWQMTGPGLLTRVFVSAVMDGDDDLLRETSLLSEWDSSRFSREETFQYKASAEGNWRISA